jgi:hypothetical protein
MPVCDLLVDMSACKSSKCAENAVKLDQSITHIVNPRFAVADHVVAPAPVDAAVICALAVADVDAAMPVEVALSTAVGMDMDKGDMIGPAEDVVGAGENAFFAHKHHFAVPDIGSSINGGSGDDEDKVSIRFRFRKRMCDCICVCTGCARAWTARKYQCDTLNGSSSDKGCESEICCFDGRIKRGWGCVRV